MIFKHILIVFLMLSLSGLVVSEDFCQMFANNGFAIDYGYYNLMNDRFLFIGHNYWRLHNKWVEREHQIELESDYSQRSDWFGSQYRVAFETSFCVYFDTTKICKLLTGLLDENIKVYKSISNFN